MNTYTEQSYWYKQHPGSYELFPQLSSTEDFFNDEKRRLENLKRWRELLAQLKGHTPSVRFHFE